MKRRVVILGSTGSIGMNALGVIEQLGEDFRVVGLSAHRNMGRLMDQVKRYQPEVIAVMREVGIDLRGARPRRFTEELAAASQLLVTMGCGEACPVVPGLTRDDWPIEDPKGLPLDRVRRIRDEIHERVDRLVAAEGWATEAVVASP